MSIQIADAAIVRDRKILLVQQRKPSAYGLWSLPGGHVEAGETLEQAVAREIEEELGMGFVNGIFMKSYPIMTPQGQSMVINTFTGDLVGNITLNQTELLAFRWFAFEEILKDKDALRAPCVIEQARDALYI